MSNHYSGINFSSSKPLSPVNNTKDAMLVFSRSRSDVCYARSSGLQTKYQPNIPLPSHGATRNLKNHRISVCCYHQDLRNDLKVRSSGESTEEEIDGDVEAVQCVNSITFTGALKRGRNLPLDKEECDDAVRLLDSLALSTEKSFEQTSGIINTGRRGFVPITPPPETQRSLYTVLRINTDGGLSKTNSSNHDFPLTVNPLIVPTTLNFHQPAPQSNTFVSEQTLASLRSGNFNFKQRLDTNAGLGMPLKPKPKTPTLIDPMEEQKEIVLQHEEISQEPKIQPKMNPKTVSSCEGKCNFNNGKEPDDVRKQFSGPRRHKEVGTIRASQGTQCEEQRNTKRSGKYWRRFFNSFSQRKLKVEGRKHKEEPRPRGRERKIEKSRKVDDEDSTKDVSPDLPTTPISLIDSGIQKDLQIDNDVGHPMRKVVEECGDTGRNIPEGDWKNCASAITAITGTASPSMNKTGIIGLEVELDGEEHGYSILQTSGKNCDMNHSTSWEHQCTNEHGDLSDSEVHGDTSGRFLTKNAKSSGSVERQEAAPAENIKMDDSLKRRVTMNLRRAAQRLDKKISVRMTRRAVPQIPHFGRERRLKADRKSLSMMVSKFGHGQRYVDESEVSPEASEGMQSPWGFPSRKSHFGMETQGP